jgi:hypothetical protein
MSLFAHDIIIPASSLHRLPAQLIINLSSTLLVLPETKLARN